MANNVFSKVKKFLDDVDDDNIVFKEHFYERSLDRPITESLIRKKIKNTTDLLKVEEQPARHEGENKYKLEIGLSKRYSLILIIAITQKNLYIITAWNTYRKWQKSIQK